MKKLFITIMFMAMFCATPVTAKETNDMSWIENLPPNQDSIETPWFIENTDDSQPAGKQEDDDGISVWVACLSCLLCFAAGFFAGHTKYKTDKD